MCIRDRADTVLVIQTPCVDIQLHCQSIRFHFNREKLAEFCRCSLPVSYTHLDVYKRQSKIRSTVTSGYLFRAITRSPFYHTFGMYCIRLSSSCQDTCGWYLKMMATKFSFFCGDYVLHQNRKIGRTRQLYPPM